MKTESAIPRRTPEDFMGSLGDSMDHEVNKVQSSKQEQWYAKYEELKARRDKWNEEGNTHSNRQFLHLDEVAVGIHTGKWPKGMAPKTSCDRCYGRGYFGKNQQGQYVPCKCIVKYMQ